MTTGMAMASDLGAGAAVFALRAAAAAFLAGVFLAGAGRVAMTRLAFSEGNDRITVPDWSARVFADCANHHSPNQTPTQWMMPGDPVRAYAERRGWCRRARSCCGSARLRQSRRCLPSRGGSDLAITPDTVAELAACGRARWKIENETLQRAEDKTDTISNTTLEQGAARAC